MVKDDGDTRFVSNMLRSMTPDGSDERYQLINLAWARTFDVLVLNEAPICDCYIVNSEYLYPLDPSAPLKDGRVRYPMLYFYKWLEFTVDKYWIQGHAKYMHMCCPHVPRVASTHHVASPSECGWSRTNETWAAGQAWAIHSLWGLIGTIEPMIPVTLVFNWDREQNLSLHIVNEAASSCLVRVNKHVLYTHIQLLYNLPG